MMLTHKSVPSKAIPGYGVADVGDCAVESAVIEHIVGRALADDAAQIGIEILPMAGLIRIDDRIRIEGPAQPVF